MRDVTVPLPTIRKQAFELTGDLHKLATEEYLNIFLPQSEEVQNTIQSIFGTHDFQIMLNAWNDPVIVSVGLGDGLKEGMKLCCYDSRYQEVDVKIAEGRKLAKLLRSLRCPTLGDEVFKKLAIYQLEWQFDTTICFPAYYKYGFRYFIEIPAREVTLNWRENPDLIPILPMDLEVVVASANS